MESFKQITSHDMKTFFTLIMLLLVGCTYSEVVKSLEQEMKDTIKKSVEPIIETQSKAQKEEKRYPIGFSVTVKDWN